MPSRPSFAIAPLEGGVEHRELFHDQGEAEVEAMVLSVRLNGARVNVLKKAVHSNNWRVVQQIFA